MVFELHEALDAFTLPYLVANADKLRAGLDGDIGAQITKMVKAQASRCSGISSSAAAISSTRCAR